MKKLDFVKSTKKYMSGLIFEIKRIGEKRVSLTIVKPIPDKDGFVNKYFKTGKTECICFYKERTMTREFFDKSFKHSKIGGQMAKKPVKKGTKKGGKMY